MLGQVVLCTALVPDPEMHPAPLRRGSWRVFSSWLKSSCAEKGVDQMEELVVAEDVEGPQESKRTLYSYRVSNTVPW